MRVITKSFLEDNGYDMLKCIDSARNNGAQFSNDFFFDIGKYSETASSVNTANRCGRLYDYKYLQGYRKNRPAAVNLALGTLVHSGLEYYWNMIGDIVDRGGSDNFHANSGGILEALDLSSGSQDADFWSDEKSDIWKCQATAYLRGYHSKYREKDWTQYHNIRPEFTFIYISEGGKLRVGKMDALMLEGDTYAVCMEHKTTSDSRINDMLSPYWAKLDIDTQVCVYREALKLIYPDRLPKMVYDVILKTAKKPLKGKGTKRKDETVGQLAERRIAGNESLVDYTSRLTEVDYGEGSEAYVRRELHLLDKDQSKLSSEIDATIELLTVKGFIDRRNPTACTYFGRSCDFLGVCSGRERIDDEGLFSSKATKHMELELAQEA